MGFLGGGEEVGSDGVGGPEHAAAPREAAV
jgi:hypothetical protein